MIWSDDTHSYQATSCPRIGSACPEATCLIRQLAQSVAKARPFTQPDFEMSGFGRLEGCQQTCSASFVATHACVRLFCGVEDDGPREALDAMADAIFDSGTEGIPLSKQVLTERPLALLEARPAT